MLLWHDSEAHGAAVGADGALVVVPYYNKPPQEGLEAHFRAIAEAAPTLPLMLYNIPGRTGCYIEAETVARLMDCPNIVSFKAASGTTEEVTADDSKSQRREVEIKVKVGPGSGMPLASTPICVLGVVHPSPTEDGPATRRGTR